MSSIRCRYFDQVAMKVSEKTVIDKAELSVSNEAILACSKVLEVTEEEARFFCKEMAAHKCLCELRINQLREQLKALPQKPKEIEELEEVLDFEKDEKDDKAVVEKYYSLGDPNGLTRFILDDDNNFSENPLLFFHKIDQLLRDAIPELEDEKNNIVMELSFLKQSSDIPPQFENFLSQEDAVIKGIKKIFMQLRMWQRRYELYIENFRHAVKTSRIVKGCDRSEQERNIKKRSIVLFWLFMLGIDDFSSLDQWKEFAVNNKDLENSLYGILSTLIKLSKFISYYAVIPLVYEHMAILLRLSVSAEISNEMQGKLKERMCRMRYIVNCFKCIPKYVEAVEKSYRYISAVSDCLPEIIREMFRYHTIIEFWGLYILKNKQETCSEQLKFLDVVKKIQTDQKIYALAFDCAIFLSFEEEILDWLIEPEPHEKSAKPLG